MINESGKPIITQLNMWFRIRILSINMNAIHNLTVPKSFGMRKISIHSSIDFEKNIVASAL